jgi:hypothetical protein
MYPLKNSDFFHTLSIVTVDDYRYSICIINKRQIIDVAMMENYTQTPQVLWDRDTYQKMGTPPTAHALPLFMQIHGAHPESLSARWCTLYIL